MFDDEPAAQNLIDLPGDLIQIGLCWFIAWFILTGLGGLTAGWVFCGRLRVSRSPPTADLFLALRQGRWGRRRKARG
jgi:hypothetical protein